MEYLKWTIEIKCNHINLSCQFCFAVARKNMARPVVWIWGGTNCLSKQWKTGKGWWECLRNLKNSHYFCNSLWCCWCCIRCFCFFVFFLTLFWLFGAFRVIFSLVCLLLLWQETAEASHRLSHKYLCSNSTHYSISCAQRLKPCVCARVCVYVCMR